MRRKLMVATLLVACVTSQLAGCATKTKSMEVNVTFPESIEQGEQQPLTWEQLALLTSNENLRKGFDDVLKITPNDTGKNGILYVDADGNNEPNNTLRVAMHNREFTKQLKDEATRLELANASASEYADIEVTDTDKAVNMGINGYFNLLPDNTPNYSNPDSTISRSEFMAMVYRAETPVQDIESDDTFTTAVGESEYNVYAQSIAEDSYLDITSKSLNNLTYNGTITRAEAIYMLMNHYFSDELATVETKGIKFEDAKDSGKATEASDYSKSDALNSALQNPDKGMPTELYKALALAQEIGLVGTESRWDEGLTKSEAIEFILIALENEKGIASFSSTQGKTSDTIEETEPVVEGNTTNTEVQASNTETKTFDRFDESVFKQDVPQEYKDKLKKYAKIMADYFDEGKNIYLEMAETDGDGMVSTEEAKVAIEFSEELQATTPVFDTDPTLQPGAADYSDTYTDNGVHGTPSSGELPGEIDFSDVDTSDMSDTIQVY